MRSLLENRCVSRKARELEEQMIDRVFWTTNLAVMVAIVAFGGVALAYVAA